MKSFSHAVVQSCSHWFKDRKTAGQKDCRTLCILCYI